MDVYDSLNYGGTPSQPMSSTTMPVSNGSTFQPNAFDAMIINQSGTTNGNNAMVSHDHYVPPTPPSMPEQRYQSNSSPTPIIPPAAASMQIQQHGSHTNTYPNNPASITSMGAQQHARAHAPPFNDLQLSQSAALIHEGLTSRAINASHSPLQVGINQLVGSMRERMHYVGLIHRVAWFLDSFTTDRNQVTTPPADQVMFELRKERNHHLKVAAYLSRQLKQKDQQIEEQNNLIARLRASIDTLTKDGAPKALSAREVIERHASLHPPSTGHPNPSSYQTVRSAQHGLHTSPTDLPVSPSSMFATPPSLSRQNQPEREVTNQMVPSKPLLPATPNTSIDLTSEDNAEAIGYAGANLPGYPVKESQLPTAAYRTPGTSPATVLDEVNEASITTNGKKRRQDVNHNPIHGRDWQFQPQWAPYPSPIPQSPKVQAWMHNSTVLQQQQQQTGEKRKSEHPDFIAPFAEPTRPTKKAKTTKAAPAAKAPKKAPPKKPAAPKKNEPRRRAPRKSRKEKLLEAESWTPAMREEQRILLGQPKSPSPPPVEKAPRALETITIADE
ncbi:MAG: hypothetical protein Q9200_000305, partial [Gallowayella weberi]